MTQSAQDWHLLRRYVESGSQEAFGLLVSVHIDMVYSSALRQLGDRHLAEEVTQAVFVILARKAAGIAQQTSLGAWLHKTTRYVALNALKVEARRRHHERKAAEMAAELRKTDASWQKLAPLLDEGMSGLSDKDRAAIMLRFFEKKSMADVGDAMGISEDAAGMRVVRAIDKLRTFFVRRGFMISAALLGGLIMGHAVQAAPAELSVTIAGKAMAAATGTALSGETTSLVDGALRMMAWAKAKLAAALVLAAVAGFVGTWMLASQLLLSPPSQNAPAGPVIEYRR